MASVTAPAEQDVQAMRKDLRDLVAVLSLPLMWRGRSPEQIAENLADVLMSLVRLDFLHLGIEPGASGHPIELTRERGTIPIEPRQLAEKVLPSGSTAPPEVLEVDTGGEPPLRLSQVAPGVQPDQWRVVAGARRPGFPTDAERFLLRVTVDQAAVGVETARLFHEAEQASRAKSQFIATMSHELRTPLNAILGYADLLTLGAPEPVGERALQHVDRIRVSARHLLELIDGILSFARIEAGHEEVRAERVDLCRLTTESAELLEPLARRGGLGFSCRVPETPVHIETDSSKVRQILFNLISNAIKFTEQGEVEVSLERADDTIVISVRDTGIGIPPEDLARIFEPFRQVEGGLTRRTGGTGLGLSVARRLCDLLGWKLEVDSEVGVGTTFDLRFRPQPERATSG